MRLAPCRILLLLFLHYGFYLTEFFFYCMWLVPWDIFFLLLLHCMWLGPLRILILQLLNCMWLASCGNYYTDSVLYCFLHCILFKHNGIKLFLNAFLFLLYYHFMWLLPRWIPPLLIHITIHSLLREFFFCYFTLHVACTLRSPSSAVFKSHISCILQNPVFAVFTLHVACELWNPFILLLLNYCCCFILLLLNCTLLTHYEILFCCFYIACNLYELRLACTLQKNFLSSFIGMRLVLPWSPAFAFSILVCSGSYFEKSYFWSFYIRGCCWIIFLLFYCNLRESFYCWLYIL